MAVAGFAETDLGVSRKENELVVSGRSAVPDADVEYLHRGLAGRPFERRFHLAEHMRVTSASLRNGLLAIELVREIPAEKKPRTISISGDQAGPAITRT